VHQLGKEFGRDPVAHASRRAHRSRLLALASVAAVLAGCAQTDKLSGMLGGKQPEAPAPVVAQAQPASPAQPTARPNLAARERLQLAMSLLEQGDVEHAKAELNAYLVEVPDSRPARTLLAQIETPVATLFPAQSFTVRVEKNESLSSLAELYLGDGLRWYGLARYNGIANAKVLEGQTIRIPKTPQTSAVLARLSQSRAQANSQNAAQQAQSATEANGEGATQRETATAQPLEPAGRIIDTGRMPADRAQAVQMAANYVTTAKTSRTSNPKQAAALAMRAGLIYLDAADRPEEAMEAFQLAVTLSPGDAQARTLLASATTKAAELYYRNGLAAFQRQDLDRAIAAWNRTLAIDPNHKNAQLNRAQALELKQNLRQLR
jgi:tetratricopeptide (TPR) repeat protein